MMTFKDLKKLVELPSYKEQRVPTVKALEVSGVPVVTEKVLENHGSINVYQNGYVIYRAHKRVTVFSLRDCVHYKYDAAEGAGHHIEEAEFDDYEWHIRLVLEGEDRIFMNYEIIQGKWMPSRENREYKEEILEGVDEAVSTLERMISEESVEELLSTLTDGQLHSTLTEGTLFYNVRFDAIAPKSADSTEQEEVIRLIINVEAQTKFKPGYPLTKRAIYYCSRMISAQHGPIFTKSEWNYSMEVGKDPQGNILRVTNALAGIERALPQVERRLENLEQQLAQAKEEAKRPFAQEAELTEKSARLAELNSLLNMDEKGSEDALGVDEDAAETEVADRPRQPVNYAGRVAERSADNVWKPSVLAQLHAKQAERTAEPQKSQKRKSYGMEL